MLKSGEEILDHIKQIADYAETQTRQSGLDIVVRVRAFALCIECKAGDMKNVQMIGWDDIRHAPVEFLKTSVDLVVETLRPEN